MFISLLSLPEFQSSSSFVLMCVYPREMSSYVHENTCVRMLIVALVVIALTWKHSKHSSILEWKNKLCYNYTIEYYTAMKNNNLPLYSATLMDFLDKGQYKQYDSMYMMFKNRQQ